MPNFGIDNSPAHRVVNMDADGNPVYASASGSNVAVTDVVPGTSATKLGKAEDAVHVSGDTGVMTLGVRTDTAVALSGTTGDYNPHQVDANGAMWATLATLIAGEDLTNNVLKVEQRFSYARMTTAATLLVKSGAGFLHSITVNTPVASGTIEFDDALTNTTPIIGKITYPAALVSDGPATAIYDVSFATGLSITTTGTMDITISYR